jgi:2-keto-3-deoxy-L-rhamnonate aldolase RhmA
LLTLKNQLKEKLYSGGTSFGTWITIGNPDIVDILKHLGFDWFVFDTEHSYLSIETVKTMVQALGSEGPEPIVRIGQVDQLLVKRALDIGAFGLVVPWINSQSEAEKIVKFSMYPPVGIRGAGPGRASRYGMNFSEYLRQANEELLIAVQIETADAISKAGEIIGTKGVDIGFVGPTDLTVSLGLLDDRSNPKVIAAMERVIKTCKDLGKIPGTLAISVDEAKKFLKLGFRFVALASDSRFLSFGAKEYLKAKD